MKLSIKALKLLLILPFLLTTNSCGNGKEITVEKAKVIYEDIKAYWDINQDKHQDDSYTRTMTAYTTTVKGETKDVADITAIVSKDDGMVYSYSKYIYSPDESRNYESEVYTYEKDGIYYVNNNVIEKERYDYTMLSNRVYSAASLYILTLKNLINYDLYASSPNTKYYSNGDGDIYAVYELSLTNDTYTYSIVRKVKYENYMFISEEVVEKKEENGEKYESVRSDSIKYKAHIKNPYL